MLPVTISVTVDYAGLPGPISSTALRLRSQEGTHEPAMVGVQASPADRADPDLHVAPRVLALQASETEPVVTGTLDLTTSNAPTSFQAGSTVPWLRLSAEQGTVPSGGGELSLTVDLSGAEPGRYVGHVVVMAGAMK